MKAYIYILVIAIFTSLACKSKTKWPTPAHDDYKKQANAIKQPASDTSPHCATSNYSKADSLQLEKFWQQLKNAVNNKNFKALLPLCNTYVDCDRCIANGELVDEMKLGGKSLAENKELLFFNDKMKELLAKPVYKAVITIKDEYSNRCTHRFGYTTVKETTASPGQQRYFDVTKINGKYKIVSAFIVP